MSLTHTTKSGVAASQNHDTKYNLCTQDPSGLLHSAGGLGSTGTLADVQVGQEFTLLGRVGIEANSPAAATTYTVNFFSKDAPYKFQILEVAFQVVDLTVADFTDGDAGNLDLTVEDGDGAASEAFTDVLADQALDDDYANGTGLRYPTATVGLTNCVIGAGESLRASLIVDPDATAGATNDGAVVDVIVRCLRVL